MNCSAASALVEGVDVMLSGDKGGVAERSPGWQLHAEPTLGWDIGVQRIPRQVSVGVSVCDGTTVPVAVSGEEQPAGIIIIARRIGIRKNKRRKNFIPGLYTRHCVRMRIGVQGVCPYPEGQ